MIGPAFSLIIGYVSRMQTPQLSIIVPVYNECDHLFLFLEMLTLQQNICFELLLCDGGSTDGTAEEAKLFASKSPFPLYVLDCAKDAACK